ncbi:MAG: twin-arginine translocase TatA/TatE family subunit [Ignavibacteriae bacterium]|nr:twin-arginine translocase TatA/TatE family subunit [Ignavibacteriota bacterium]MCB0724071.1 twin-arginine translocase TatA/TatE family subunit [Ignavibacteriota bacterium]MCB9243885.1 twin-arginine translocase TatA/TatE family subunit [Ignavibacteriales bacterium]
MFGLGTPEIVLIAIVILVLFGAKKIPELMQGLGKGVKEFKKATSEIEKDIKSSTEDKNPTEQNPTTPK